jgi:hypothetical protein
MTSVKAKKLNEKELGSLYLTAETPLIIDRLLKAGNYSEGDITSIHNSLSKHAPDMAMIALSLSGNMIAEALKSTERDDVQPLAAELKYLSVNTVEEVGRIWIDACRYGIENEEAIHDLVHDSADILCMFSSIFMEVAEACTPEPDTIRALAACAMYQAEAHADSAASMVDNADNKKPQKTNRDFIPLPAELSEKQYTDNVVAFSLFGEAQQ